MEIYGVICGKSWGTIMIECALIGRFRDRMWMESAARVVVSFPPPGFLRGVPSWPPGETWSYLRGGSRTWEGNYVESMERRSG